jgi:hypothetical protein
MFHDFIPLRYLSAKLSIGVLFCSRLFDRKHAAHNTDRDFIFDFTDSVDETPASSPVRHLISPGR